MTDIEKFRDSLSLLSMWIAMHEAQAELAEEGELSDDLVALTFMGSGASCSVYLGDLRRIVRGGMELLETCEPRPFIDDEFGGH